MERPRGSLISFFSNMVKERGGINLAQGIPGFNPPEELLKILSSNIFSGQKIHQYAPGRGDPQLIELIADLYSSYAKVGADNVLVVQGATEGLSLIFLYISLLIKERFSVLSFDPPYESYPMLSKFYGCDFEYFNLQSDGSVDFDRLETSIVKNSVRVIVFASPGNPMGRIWKTDELEELNKISLKYGIFIVFDAVYKDIFFSEKTPNPLVFENPRLFYVDSFSKMLSITGWRLGYIIGSQEHMKEIFGIHDYTGLSASHVLQSAVRDYLKESDYGKEYAEFLRTECMKSCNIMKDVLKSCGFNMPDPDGGYFIWADIPELFKDGFEFSYQLFEKEKVAVVPGENFSPDKKRFVRINFAQNPEVIREAAAKIRKFVVEINSYHKR